MQGVKIPVGFDGDDLKKIIEQFKQALDKMQSMSENQKLHIGLDEGISKQLEIIAQKMDNVGKKAEETGKKMKTVFDATKSGSKLKNDNIDKTSFDQLESIMGRIKRDLNTITKVDIMTNSKGKITEAVIEYENGVGKIAKETLKLKSSIKTIDGEKKNVQTLVTDTIKYTDNIKKSISVLNSFKTQLDSVKKGFGKVDFLNNNDATKLEATYNKISRSIQTLTESGKSLSTSKANQIKGAIEGLKQEAEQLIKNNNLAKQDIENQKQLMLYNYQQSQNQRKESVQQDTKEILAEENAKIENQNKLYKEAKDLQKSIYDLQTKRLQPINAESVELPKRIKGDIENLEVLKEQLTVEQKKLLNLEEEKLFTEYILAEEKQITAEKDKQDKKTKSENSRVSRLGTKIEDSPLSINTDNGSLEKYIKSLHDSETQILRINNALDKNENSIKQVEYKTRDGANGWKVYQLNIDKTTDSTYRLDKGTREFQNRQLSFTQSLALGIKKFVEYQLVTKAVYETINQLRNGFNFVNELNKSLTEIGVVTYQGQSQMKEYGKVYNDLAKEMRVTTGEIANASVEFYRQGLEQDEVMRRLQTTTQYAKISNLEFKESAEILTATVNSMGVGIDKVSDVFSYLGDATATGSDEIGRSMQKVAGTSNALQVPLEKTTSWIALLSSKTREGSEVIGNSIKSLMLRYEQLREKGFTEDDGTKVNQVAKALNEVGIRIIDAGGNFRNFGTVMDELGQKWDTLDNRHKAYISTQMAGKLLPLNTVMYY